MRLDMIMTAPGRGNFFNGHRRHPYAGCKARRYGRMKHMFFDGALQPQSPLLSVRKLQASRLRVRLYALLMALDQLCILAAFGLAHLAFGRSHGASIGLDLIFLVAPLYFTLALMSDGYSRRVLENADYSIGRVGLAIFVTGVATLTSVFLLGASGDVSRLSISSSLVLSALLLAIARKMFAMSVRKRFGSTVSTLMIVDDPSVMAADLLKGSDVLDAQSSGLRANVGDPMKMHEIGMVLSRYDRVVVHCERERRDDWALVLKGGNVLGEIVHPSLRNLGAVGIGTFGDEHTLVIARGPLSLSDRLQKRIFDLAFTLPVLVAILPLLTIIAILIKVDSRGPVLFKQKRIGRGNRLFDIYKFRSMRTEQLDHSGSRSASRDDDRITRVGRIIRKTSMDELPQLFNVLLGDMSLVGPRPHALGSLAGDQLFWDVSREYWCRHALKPGITGLAQVRGFRGATHQMSDLQNRLEADLEYMSGWTLMRDLHILLSTVKVLLHKNAY